MKMKRYLVSLAAILPVMAAGSARAQAPQTPVQLQPGVARVSLIHGDVSTQRGDSGDWVAATLNTPIVVGDHVSTGQRSHAEVQLDYANLLRLSDNATAKIANLTRTRIQVQVGQGLATYSVLKGSEADVEIDTPNVAIHPLGEGSYRIQVNPDGETQVIIRKGAAEVSTPQGSTRVEKGQLITIQGTDNPQYQTASAPRKDDWDHLNDDRDHRVGNAESWQHTSRYYEGTEDLDTYGHWVHVPDYNYVWVPAQGPGWVPYRDGRWVWEPYYGWTWVSYEPWGWAPYHYGRWFLYGGSWCWWPGPVVVYPAYRPLWAPAYVSFFGFGLGGRHSAFGFNVGFGGFGSVGWLPIGPADHFFPWYGRSVNRVNVVNVTNITNITNINNIHNEAGIRPILPLARSGAHPFSNVDQALTNPRVRQALTSMPANQFGQARAPVHPQPIDATAFRQGSVLTGAVPVTPTRESLRPTDRQVNPGTIPARLGTSQRFFTKSQPAAGPEPFHEQVAQVQRMMEASRTNLAANAQTSRPTLQPGSPARLQQEIGPSKPGRPTGTTSSQTMTATRSGTPTESQTNQRPGWHSFGPRDQGNSAQGGGPTREQNPTSGTKPNGPASPYSGGQTSRTAQQPASNNRPPQTARPSPDNNPTQRPFTPPSPHPSESTPAGRQDGWQRFTPPSRQTQPESGSLGSGGQNGRQSFPSRPAPSRSSEPQRQWQPPASRGSSQTVNRPPLNLRQPIVTPRAPSSHENSGPRGGSHGGATGGHGSNSAPSHSSSGHSSTERSQ